MPRIDIGFLKPDNYFVSDKQSTFQRNYRFWILFSRMAALSLLMAALAVNLCVSNVLLSSDFATAFWIAGHVISSGQINQLYPSLQQNNFIGAFFDKYTHQLLPDLPPTFTALFMYSPLTALLFVPFSYLPLKTAMLTWQLISVAALFASAFIFARLTKQKPGNFFFMSMLYLPVFHSIAVGQLGLVFGLLPLILGYFCLSNNQLFRAGMFWSLLILKPQFLPAAGLVALANALSGRWRCLLGLITGCAVLGLITAIIVSPAVIMDWLRALKLSDAIYSSGDYAYNEYMMCSQQAALLQLFPPILREWLKIISYVFSLAVVLYTLFTSVRVIKSYKDDYIKAATPVCLMAILSLPLIVPHFVFYDLSAYVLVGMIIFSYAKDSIESSFRKLALIGWICINVYFLLFATVFQSIPPIILLVVLFEMYRRVVRSY